MPPDKLGTAKEIVVKELLGVLKARNLNTLAHSQRVANLSLQLGYKLQLSERKLDILYTSALLHDIGKIVIPDQILHKRGPLTAEEWELMKKHPESGAKTIQSGYESILSLFRPTFHELTQIKEWQIINQLSDSEIETLQATLQEVSLIVLCHHERWDGAGYPGQLKGEAIPLSAQICAITEVFDALTSDQPYRQAWPRDKALQQIEQEAGQAFAPSIVTTFAQFANHLL